MSRLHAEQTKNIPLTRSVRLSVPPASCKGSPIIHVENKAHTEPVSGSERTTLKQVTVCSCSCKIKNKLLFRDFIDQQPIRGDMALPAALIIPD